MYFRILNFKKSPYYTGWLAVSVLLLFLLFNGCKKESISDEVYIPDESFLNALIKLGIDTDNNGLISEAEALAVRTIQIWPSDIGDLTGIEYFTNLDTFSVIMNPLNEIDLSFNKNLRYLELIGCGLSVLDLTENRELSYLDCSSKLAMKNYLSELDVSNHHHLEYLSCEENQINHLDISANPELSELHLGYNKLAELDIRLNDNLTKLHCNNNQLTHLDLSGNINLREVISCGNKLNTLDISKNTHLEKIGIDNMPGLTQVYVWTLPFPPPGISILMGFSPNVEFIIRSNLMTPGL